MPAEGAGVTRYSVTLGAANLVLCTVYDIYTDAIQHVPQGRIGAKGVTLLALFREVHASPVINYEPNALVSARFRALFDLARAAELTRIYNRWSVSLAYRLAVRGCGGGVPLTSGTPPLHDGKPHRAPRLYFFLMHVLTSALCFPRLLKAMEDPVHEAKLLHGYAHTTTLFVLVRGRRIHVPLLVSYTEHPRRARQTRGSRSCIGKCIGVKFSKPDLSHLG
ncbi:hypothetical protein FB451DRAFT_1492355 [Mycena latifolia]|nr:hypothetical protein FB451DRAFT_1492355 [Mycena latifolia]